MYLFEIFLFQAETNDNMGLSLSVEPSEAISLQLLLRTHKTKPSIVPGFQSCCGSPLFSAALSLAFLKSMLQLNIVIEVDSAGEAALSCNRLFFLR